MFDAIFVAFIAAAVAIFTGMYVHLSMQIYELKGKPKDKENAPNEAGTSVEREYEDD